MAIPLTQLHFEAVEWPKALRASDRRSRGLERDSMGCDSMDPDEMDPMDMPTETDLGREMLATVTDLGPASTTSAQAVTLESIQERLDGLTQLSQHMFELQASLLASQQEVCASLLKPSRPAREPPLMSVVPGQVNELVPKEMGKESQRPSLLMAHRSDTIRSRVSGQRRSACHHVASMDDLEQQTASMLLKRSFSFNQKSDNASSSSEESELGSDDSCSTVKNPAITLGAALSTPVGDKRGVLAQCRRMSLDDLRANHDAVIAKTTPLDSTRAIGGQTDDVAGALTGVAKLWLRLVGILDWPCARLGRLWQVLLLISLLSLSGCLFWFSLPGTFDPYMVLTTLCHALGVAGATLTLHTSGVQALLGPNALEDYARRVGFLRDWRRLSKWRLQQTCVPLGVMLLCRCLDLQTLESWEEFSAGVHSAVALSLGALSYTHLHLVAGLELAIDSFTINFYKELNIPQALEEWNVVQATMRQVSNKLSQSLAILGSTCGLSLLLLLERVLISPHDFQVGWHLLFFCGWLFCPVLLFLYAMLLAANVTAKASRVAPLVNSWTFEEGSSRWMDVERQYVVQYIQQSEAGFYMNGVRLHVSNVAKLGYYLGAFVFAVISRLWQ
ncbi:unnamed protein product [Effrenium voratum]|nr:unnamed protein product [Effrenium voratum]